LQDHRGFCGRAEHGHPRDLKHVTANFMGSAGDYRPHPPFTLMLGKLGMEDRLQSAIANLLFRRGRSCLPHHLTESVSEVAAEGLKCKVDQQLGRSRIFHLIVEATKHFGIGGRGRSGPAVAGAPMISACLAGGRSP
jgi:hypothetical protein